MMHIKYLKSIVILSVLFLVGTVSFATEETYTNRFNSAGITSGGTYEVIDGRYDDLGAGLFVDKSTSFLLKLGIEEREDFGYLLAHSFSLSVTVRGYDESNELISTDAVTLSVSYDPNGDVLTDQLSYFQTTGGYRYEVEFIGTPAPVNVYLEGELTIDRFYHLDVTTVPLSSALGCNYLYYDPTTNVKTVVYDVNQYALPSTSQEIEVWWDYIEGAEEYELEWTWIDNYSSDFDINLASTEVFFSARDLELNNTRIITTDQRYQVPLVYNKGFLIYRVRAVGRWTDNDLLDVDKRIYGKWSTDGVDLSSPTMIATWPHWIELTSTHEALKNWQYQAVYAEEGKKKEIVSYFDGSLRNRQTVTRINSNKEAIVGENIYDNQGRSAIQVLPTPIDNSALRYYSALNLNSEGVVYSHDNFDWDTGDCIAAADPMNTESGASHYYTNDVLNRIDASGNWQDYVPDAGGYPFVQVQYTPDNTGRIRSQSGVGSDFTITSGRSTEYYYLQPFQEELNRLFGYEVGFKSHYKKNLVVDANGQVSISYIDPQGRVIATALAGDNVTGEGGGVSPSLVSLTSEEDDSKHLISTVDLLNKLDVDATDTELDDNFTYISGMAGPEADALLFNTEHGVTDNDKLHELDYRVRTSVYTDACMTGLSYPFAYQLDIDILDDCGNSMIDGGPVSELIVGDPGVDYAGATGADESRALTATLSTGSYSLHKMLRIDQAKLDEYVEHYMENNTCLLTFEDFLESSPCVYEDIPAEDAIEVNRCTVTEQMMLSDLSPGGQYGNIDFNDVGLVEDPLSIFNAGNVIDRDATEIADPLNEHWRNPFSPYLDADGSTSLIYYEGVFQELDATLLTEIDLAVFLDQWRTSWAASLLPYHPEYCYLEYANALCSETALIGGVATSSEDFNNALQTVNTYADAISISNTLGIDLIGSNPDVTNILKTNDPYFQIDYSVISDATLTEGDALKHALMDEILTNYKSFDGSIGATGMSLWEYSLRLVLCGADFDGVCTMPATIADLEGLSYTDEQRNLIWNTYKQHYLAEKGKIDQLFIDMHAMREGCYNEYIGSLSPESPSLMAFAYYPEFLMPLFEGGESGYTGETIIDLYISALATMPESEPFGWFTELYNVLFAEKEQRFQRADALYESGVPEDEMMDVVSTRADVGIYEATGRCALSFDVEYLLNSLSNRGHLYAGASVDSDLVPEFTRDLYIEMGGGVITDEGVTGYGVTLDVTSTVDGLEITSANTIDGLTLANSIRLTSPAIFGWDWADVTGVEMLYYEPNTETAGVYPFEILVHYNEGTELDPIYKEVVVLGETEVQIGDCGYDPECERANIFASNIAALYNQLWTNDSPLTLGEISDLDDVALNSIIEPWYSTSELNIQLNDADYTATIISDFSDQIILQSSDYEITIDFSSPSESLNIAMINGSTFDVSTNTVTIYYINTDGESASFTGVITYEDALGATEVLDLDCGCRVGDQDDLESYMKDLLNFILDEVTYGAAVSGYLTGSYPSLAAIIQGLEPFMVNPSENTGIWDVTWNAIGIDFKFEHITGCNPFFSCTEGDMSALATILSVNVIPYTDGSEGAVIEVVGEEADGTIVRLVANQVTCFEFEPCDNCTPTAVAPKSCNTEWESYDTWVTSKNALVPDGDDLFETYTESEFCETNFAFAAADYAYYIDHFGITSPEDDYYLTLSEFILTEIGMGMHSFDELDVAHTMESVIDAYKLYVDNPANDPITWHAYVSDVYLLEHTICPPVHLMPNMDLTIEYPCEMYTANVDTVNAMNDYATYLENMEEAFRQRYTEEAISSVIENFNMTYPDKEYYYTLYYYDQAGNLVQTVPPKGVDRLEAGIINNDEINDLRADDLTSADPSVLPNHDYQTQYHYNSLNQLVWQETPDGGESYFGYDELGRLVVSQNAKQAAAVNEQFSYTRYDGLGRIIEVGEMTLSTDYGFDANGRFIDPVGGLVDVSAAAFPSGLLGFLSAEEVTKTKYDELEGIESTDFADYASDNTRNRITGVYYYETYVEETDDFTTYDNATFYDYDVHGNVKELVQKINDTHLEELEHDLKKVEYEYDLVSGNVKHVTYQKDEADQFIHEYEYDADNRITNVRTSNDAVIWEQDAKYFYYDHGPLARTEIGDQKVVANDYAYTIQGWLKGVNSQDLNAANDQGKDSQAGMNRMSGKDVYGYSLHYFADDYNARHGNDFLAYSELTASMPSNQSLYNGNIRQMYTAATDINENNIGTNHTVYQYDQLNRIKTMNQELLEGVATPVHDYATLAGNYESEYSFDASGNLETLKRWADNAGAKTLIDDFTYHYTTGANQLTHVDDAAGEVITSVDLADQSLDNYTYTEIGELYSDAQEEIAEIKWKVTGKVHKIIRTGESDKSNLEFVYDAMGNRIIKIERDNVSDEVIKKTYYIRDAQGNVLNIYTFKEEYNELTATDDANLYLTERSIYGSSRLGTENINEVIASSDISNVNISPPTIQVVGDRHYELSNHLGNVLQVVTDRKLAVDDGTGAVDYYIADVVSQSDYFPFGMTLPGRDESADDYRYGFNGMEKDDEVKGNGNSYTTPFRQYDPRVGRWKTLDPLMQKYPNQSAYAGFNNNPIYFADPTGLEGEPQNFSTSNVMISSQVDEGNKQIVSATKMDVDINYSSSTERTRTTSVSSISNTVSPYASEETVKGTEVTTVQSKIKEKFNSQKGVWEQVGEEKITTSTSLLAESDEFTDGDLKVLQSWTDHIEKYNHDNEDTFNEMVQNKLKDATLFGYTAGLLPYVGAAPGAGKFVEKYVSKKLQKALAAAGVPTSTKSLLSVLADKMMPANNFMVHSIKASDNGELIKQHKTPDSKDKNSTGPSSWQDLFDGDKWCEVFPYFCN